MPRRFDSLDAYWLAPVLGNELIPELIDDDVDFPTDMGGEFVRVWQVRLKPDSALLWARVWTTDRLGFRYSRLVGLNSLVSQSEAALLLDVPLMRVNRWVRAGRLPTSLKRGSNGVEYSVILVAELLKLGIDQELTVRVGREAVRSRGVPAESLRPGDTDTEKERPYPRPRRR